MSADPVLAAIDDTLEAVQPKTCACGCGARLGPASKSMYYAAERCQHRWMGRGKASTASGPGWVWPAGVRYEPIEVGELRRVMAQDRLRGADLHRVDALCAALSIPLSSFDGPVPGTEPIIECDSRVGAGFGFGPAPAEPTLSNDVATHRVEHPLRVWWAALARKVRR